MLPSPFGVATLRVLAALFFFLSYANAQTPSKDLKSSDPLLRLAAISALDVSAKGADKALLRALKDPDWEVRERAAKALGKSQSKLAIKPLVALCFKGPTRRLRRAAARALAGIDAGTASKLLAKKLRGKTLVQACQALSTLQLFSDEPQPIKKLDKLMQHKLAAVREAAAEAWFASSPERGAACKKLMGGDIIVACAVLSMMTEVPRAKDLSVLRELLQGPLRNPVIERRLLAAACAACVASSKKSEAAKELIAALSGSEAMLVRRARILSRLVAANCITAKQAVPELEASLSGSTPARAAAAHSLRLLGGEAATAAGLAAFEHEKSARVRLQLLESVTATRGLARTSDIDWVAARLKDPDADVRIAAAVLLGHESAAGVGSLRKALGDSDWRVRVCAAVSLGKTRAESALAGLVGLAKNQDWKMRGAAAVAWMHQNRQESVQPLIAALSDKSPIVRRTAHEALCYISYERDIEASPKAWRAWWDKHLAKHSFIDRAKEKAKRDKYGYAVADREIYKGLDVVVLLSRGDHIEKVLEKLAIKHRTMQSSKVPEATIHPEAICVINCTGEIEARDIEPLTWFVHSGGALFGSCWALHETIAKIFPGVLKKFATPRGEVLDNVRAYPCSKSPYLNGVFTPGVRPIYHLEGAHLIDVVDPERAEVLIDSPDAAQRHGSGELAAWFRAGHGVIMDSVNHFDLQGLELAQGLKTPAQRQAYAIDHMGLSYALWRKLRKKKKLWSSSQRAATEVPDLSAFRIITNFVRAKRTGKTQ